MAEKVKADESKSSDVVMVACKLPTGLVLEIVQKSETLQPLPAGQRYVLKGANSLRDDKRVSQASHPYAVTPVPRDFWEAWLKQNADLEFVRKGFVFAESSAERAAAKGLEMVGERTGLEALATEKDPRVIQIGRMGGANVETDPEALGRAMAASG